MIQFNLTLLVQVLNFSITFYVLKRFLFEPFIKNIIDRKKEEKRLRDEILLKRKDVDNFLNEKTLQLSQFQKDATTDFPFRPVTSYRAQTIPQQECIIEPSTRQQADLQEALIKKVHNGCE